MTSLFLDLRYCLRLIVRKPALTAFTVISLAFGIGVNTAIFTLVNAVLLRDTPIVRPQEVVEVYTSSSDGFPYSTSSVPDYLDFRVAGDEVFSGLAAHQVYPLTYDDGESTELLMGEIVSGNLFDVLGIAAAHGRMFLPEEDGVPNSRAVAVLGHTFWQRRFGGDPGVLGRTLKLNGTMFTVVGMAPPSFKGMFPALSMDLWIPLGINDQIAVEPELEERGRRSLFLKGRLRSGVTREQAEARLDLVAERLGKEHPRTNEGRTVSLVPVREVVINPGFDDKILGAAGFLMAIVGMVLLIACSNIANLFLAQASTRRRELAVRLSLGSSRFRLIRQLLTESLLISTGAGLLSLVIAVWSTRLLLSLQPPIPLPLSLDLGFDVRVFGFALVLSVLSGVFCGLAPALQASRGDLIPALKAGAEVAGHGPRRFGLRNLLVVTQVAVSMLLLIGTGLFARSLIKAQQIDPGFSLRQGVVASLMPELGGAYQGPQLEVFYRQVSEKARALPGVDSAALAEFLPLGLQAQNRSVYFAGEELPAGEDAPPIDTMAIGPGYFETLGINLLHGRDFTTSDSAEAPGVVIVNETLARRAWPGEDPLGKRLRFSDRPEAPFYEVVGVTRDGKYRTLGEAPRPFVYTSHTQQQSFMMSLILASRNEARSVELLRQMLVELDPNLPIFEIKTISRHLEVGLLMPRMVASLLGAMGLLGLLLASLGIYAVVAHSVVRRTHELGVRMALGADRGDVLRAVMREGMILVGIGALLGVVSGLVVTRALGSLLYGVAADDPMTYGAVVLFLILVAGLANFLPARRATGLDPIRALRHD